MAAPNNLTSFPRVAGASLADVQRDAYKAFQELGPLAYAKELVDVLVGTTSTPVPHGLGYPPKHVVVSRGFTAAISEAAAPDATYVYLVTSGSARTVNLLVV